jgi:hypothetical protein
LDLGGPGRNPPAGLSPSRLKFLLPTLVLALLAGPAFGQGSGKPRVYNNLDGDGSVAIDRVIKQAYGRSYDIVDTGAAQGYAGPVPLRGDLPHSADDESGHPLIGYALVVYIINADGLVADPVVVRANDPRLNKVALDAMVLWRFQPATVNGTAVASTAAQEFNFGPVDVSNGFRLGRVVVYQPVDVLVKRMPAKGAVEDYIRAVVAVAHGFFVGDTVPEYLDIVLVVRPGRASRAWFRSSLRPGGAPALEPLRQLVEAVPAIDVAGGPVILTLGGVVAGGDPRHPRQDEHPIPDAWQALAKGLPAPPAYSSDAFLDLLWPGP